MDPWPPVIRTLRSYLPAGMRVLRGGMGILGGGALIYGAASRLLFGANWHLGFSSDGLVASAMLGALAVARFLVLIVGVIGIGSPIWYWLVRPVWVWMGKPGARFGRPFRDARFLRGLAGTVGGAGVWAVVSAQSRFGIQTLAPFGALLVVLSPLWYWLLRPIAGSWINNRIGRGQWWRQLPGMASDQAAVRQAAQFGWRILPSLGVLFAVSMVLTAATSLPVVAVGNSITEETLAVTVSETRTTAAVIEVGDRTVGDDVWRLLLVQLTVVNRDDPPRELWGRPADAADDITVIAPTCDAHTFGEPANNCYPGNIDSNFTVNGEEFTSFRARQPEDGMIAPGQRITGWVVFRIEHGSESETVTNAMIIVDGIGRWTAEVPVTGADDTQTPTPTPTPPPVTPPPQGS